ncbi:MAG: glycolate oxidase subunit GlcE [Porticoccaceae bacterium]|nr:glycolate oxidase subunit GlcE [Porticoccaceae bacterium]
MDPILTRWADRIDAAADQGTPLRLQGGNSKDFYGNPGEGQVLDTREYRGIVSYEPTELVITARCGTPLIELEAALAEKNQCLPFEPPRFAGATVGGSVAAGLSGPRRIQAGPLRDFVLGAQLMDGRGRLMDFGGQVMKNVAGYDVSRLLAGSLGVLGLITELSLKVLPLPMAERTLMLPVAEQEALALVTRWRSRPLPIAATAWRDGILWSRLAGARAAVEAACWELPGEPLDEHRANDFWSQLRDQQLDFFTGKGPLWRLAVPANTPPLNAGETLVEWSGGQRWLYSELPPETVRALARERGGHATLFRRGTLADETFDEGTFAPLPEPVMALHRKLKAQFDPAGIFNPGRLYPDL